MESTRLATTNTSNWCISSFRRNIRRNPHHRYYESFPDINLSEDHPTRSFLDDSNKDLSKNKLDAKDEQRNPSSSSRRSNIESMSSRKTNSCLNVFNYKNDRVESVKTNEIELLLEETKRLRQQLNIANNTIRDLENVNKKKGINPRLEKNTVLFASCSFIPRKPKQTVKNVTDSIDERSFFSAAACSQASTVRMGTSTKQKKNKKLYSKPYRVNQRKRSDEKCLLDAQEDMWQNSMPPCPQSFLRLPKTTKRQPLPNNRQQRRNNIDRMAKFDTIHTTELMAGRIKTNDVKFDNSRNEPLRNQRSMDEKLLSSLLVNNDVMIQAKRYTEPPIYIHDRQAAAYNMNHLSQATMLCAPFSRLAADSTSSSDHSEVGCSEKGVEGHQEQEDFYFDDYEKIEATNSFGGDLGGIEVLYPSSSTGSTGSTTSSTDESSGVRRIEI